MRLHLILAVAAGLAVTACAPRDMADYDYRQRHAVTVASGIASATIARPAEGKDLSATDAAVLNDLAAEHVRRAAGPIIIEAAPGAFAESLAARLNAAGVAPERIQMLATPDAANATIKVPVWLAKVPECGQWPDRINPDFRNENTWNFGCAVTRNIGLMVSDPADLVRARPATGRDANRAVDVLSKYGQGKATGSEAEAKPTGGVSSVGK